LSLYDYKKQVLDSELVIIARQNYIEIGFLGMKINGLTVLMFEGQPDTLGRSSSRQVIGQPLVRNSSKAHVVSLSTKLYTHN